MYKTIVLELIKERKALYKGLKRTRKLPAEHDRLAKELRASHERWMESLPSNEALEMALNELIDSLPPDSTTEEEAGLTLDGAMAHALRPTKHA